MIHEPPPVDTTPALAGVNIPAEPAAPPEAFISRRQPRRRLALAGASIALVAAGLAVYWAWFAAPPLGALKASGTLEADETLISAQVSARITELPLPEGSKVSAGDVVANLDDRLIQLKMQEADVSSRRQLELQQEYYTLRAPIGGLITRVPSKVGETAMPGQVLLAIAPTGRLKLTLYVREAELAQVSVGQEVAVSADPFPGRVFSGVVSSINSQAEFTPRNIQTQTDRLNLVFGVQAYVSNSDGALKPGMPVDARFVPTAPA